MSQAVEAGQAASNHLFEELDLRHNHRARSQALQLPSLLISEFEEHTACMYGRKTCAKWGGQEQDTSTVVQGPWKTGKPRLAGSSHLGGVTIL